MKPIDVAGILERAARDLAIRCPEADDSAHDELIAARAAIAELIAATKDNTAGCPCPGCDRVRAALARFESTP